MSRKLPSISRYQSSTRFTTTSEIFNSTDRSVIIGRKSKIQRWLFAMITGSAPFLVILFCWMFVSLCINNLVRFYQYRKNRYRQNDTRTNEMDNTVLKTDV
jgi:hypothetical protein